MWRLILSILIRVREAIYVLPAPPVLRMVGDLIYRTSRNFSRDDGSHMAAGVAYYAMFSLFPLVLAIIAIASFFLDQATIQERVLDFLERELPGAGDSEVIQGNIQRLADARGALSIVAVLSLLWSGRAVFGAIHRVLNRAWQVTERPHFVLQQLLQAGSALGIAFMFLVATLAGTVGRALILGSEVLTGTGIPWDTLFNLMPYVVNTVFFSLVYRYVPDVHVRWRDALPAAFLAGSAFELAKIGFAFYLANLSALDLIYGSITTVVVLLLFLYVIGIILAMGAELCAELGRSWASGVLAIRGHWRPVRGGLAPITRRHIEHPGDEPTDRPSSP